MLVNDASELVLPTAIYLFAILAAVTIAAFRHRGGALWRWRWALAGSLVWCWIFSTPGFARIFAAALESRFAPTADPARGDPLIVALSSGEIVPSDSGDGWKPQLDQSGWARTYAAVALWKRTGGMLRFVGEPTPDGKGSVAQAMAAVAMTSGVPEAAITVETRSRNTYENLAFSRDLIAARDGDVWLVTSALHMPRAMAVAKKLGLRVRPQPCDFRAVPLVHWFAWLPNSGGPSMFHAALHEWVGLAYYRLRGWA
jgi:uncharacterized SAM-binding protein YcdF (DUF218 family)